MDDIDKTANCLRCGGLIEHYAGIPGSEFMTPFWRHVEIPARAHAAVLDEATVVVAVSA